MNAITDLEQLRADLDSLSAQELKKKYPELSTKSLKELSIEELEQRISKSHSGILANSLHDMNKTKHR